MPRIPSLALLAALLAGPASADWLVMKDGARIETRGVWEVRGKSVVFTAKNGTLSSLSLRDVDLDKSAELTSAPIEALAPAIEFAGPKAVRSIGPDDVPRARPSFAAADAGGAAGEDGASGESAPGAPSSFAEQLQVTSWEKYEPSWLEGIELVGRIANHSESTATELSVTVRIFDEEGRTLASQRAFLESRSLLAGQSLDFRLPFEGVNDFATVEFDVSATEVVLGVGVIDAFDETLAEEEDEAATDESGSF